MVTHDPRFLNVDLEVESRSNLEPLVAAIASAAFPLNSIRRAGRHIVRFELNRQPSSADEAIRGFDQILRRLPPAARRLWVRARRRDFDVGIEARPRSVPALVALSQRTVELVAKLRGRVLFTAYAPSRNGSPSNKRLKLAARVD